MVSNKFLSWHWIPSNRIYNHFWTVSKNVWENVKCVLSMKPNTHVRNATWKLAVWIVLKFIKRNWIVMAFAIGRNTFQSKISPNRIWWTIMCSLKIAPTTQSRESGTKSNESLATIEHCPHSWISWRQLLRSARSHCNSCYRISKNTKPTVRSTTGKRKSFIGELNGGFWMQTIENALMRDAVNSIPFRI